MKPLDIPVEEFTSTNPVIVHEGDSLEDLEATMKENGIRHLPVARGQEIVGIISQRDLKVASRLGKYRDMICAKDIMIETPFTVSSSTKLDDVAFAMSKNKIGSAIVNDENGNFLGIFTSTDALNALIEVVRGIDPNQ